MTGKMEVDLTLQDRKDMTNDITSLVSEYQDAETKVSVYVGRPRRKMPDFTLFFQAINRVLAMELSPVECKLLMLLYSEAGYSNYMPRSILTLSEDCKISRRTISRALKKLMKLHILTRFRAPNDSRYYEYMINPYVTWKGGMPERDKAMKIIRKKLNKFPGQLKLFAETEEGSMNNKKSINQ